MSDLLPDDVMLIDLSESQEQQVKVRGIPLKACVGCGKVWKYTHYCLAEFEECGSCGKTGHYMRFCRFSSSQKKKNNLGEDNNESRNRDNDQIPQGQSEESEKTPPKRDENKENSNREESYDFYEDNYCENGRKKTYSPTEENDENHGRRESRYSPGPEAKSSGPSHTFVPGTRYESIELKKKLAKQFYVQGRYEAALSHYSRLTELCPNNALIFNNKCACYMMLGQYENALADAVKVINLNPSSIKGHCRLLKCGILLGNTTLVELSLSKLSSLDPDNETLQYARERLNELENYLEEEKIAVNDKNYQKALKIVKYCLHVSPLSLPFKLKEAEYLVLVERFDESVQLVDEIMQKNPRNIEAKYVRGLILYYNWAFYKSAQSFKEILHLAPDHEKSLAVYKKAKLMSKTILKVRRASRSGNYARAHKLYSSVLQTDFLGKQGNIRVYQGMGASSFHMGYYQQAISEFSEVLRIDSTLTQTLRSRGEIYMHLRNYEEAIADFSRVCNLETDAECQKLLQIAEEQLASVKKTPYEILEVNENASIMEIEKAYEHKAMNYHPDRHLSDTVEQKTMHERKFKSITLAYRTLQAELDGNKGKTRMKAISDII